MREGKAVDSRSCAIRRRQRQPRRPAGVRSSRAEHECCVRAESRTLDLGVSCSSLPGQGGEQVYVTVALGANLCQIDAGIGDSAFRLTQFDPCIEAGLEPLLGDGKYLRPLLFGTLRNVRKCIGTIQPQV
jgi:hypothetical protein